MERHTTPASMIYYSHPYDVDKIYGRAHNIFCSLVPHDDDWVCITDGDVMFLHPEWGRQIEDVVRKHGDYYQVFGCLTNRLAGVHQQYKGRFSHDPDVQNHINIAHECYLSHYDEVAETNVNVAAMLMVFKKSTWRDAGGFPENTLAFDRKFTDKVQASGGKLAIMQGLYVFHLYRFNKPNPTQYIDHLV